MWVEEEEGKRRRGQRREGEGNRIEKRRQERCDLAARGQEVEGEKGGGRGEIRGDNKPL